MAIMAMIAATLLDPGVYFAINVGAGVVGADAGRGGPDHHRLGLPRDDGPDGEAGSRHGRATLFARTGGAPSLAVGWRAFSAPHSDAACSASGITSPSCSRRCSS